MSHRHMNRKQKSFPLQRGLYVVRYDASADPGQPPLVSITCTAGCNEVILSPDQTTATMSAPGQAIVIRASQTGNVHVELASRADGSTLDATLKFEQLRAGGQVASGRMPDLSPQAMLPQPSYQQPSYHVPAQASYTVPALPSIGTKSSSPVEPMPGMVQRAGNLDLLGHVARLGDVVVKADEWLGGPAAPARIEGFMLRWAAKPADVSIRYAATLAGQRPGENRFVELGDFAGTKGKARPILGVMLELTGHGARNYNLIVEALFLGAPARRSTGQSITASGPTGREPLVGMRVSVVSQQVADRPQVSSPRPQLPAMAPAGKPGGETPAANDPRRVRVFRA